MRRVAALALAWALGCTGYLETGPGDGTHPPDGGVPDDCAQIRCPPTSVCVAGACVSRDPCLGVECPPSFVCSAGSCVNARLDEDGDGFPAASDCDDRDPRVVPGSVEACTTACGEGTATCADGHWQPCTAPSECACVPGATRAEACGRCGTATRRCGDDGIWEPSATACGDGGACSPGATELDTCPGAGACSRRERTCSNECAWSDYGACDDSSECGPDEREDRACGACGDQGRVCTDQCLWAAWSDCAGEGVCQAGEDEERACGNCGTERRSCRADCTYGAWGQCEQGSCTPGNVQERDCGFCGTEARSCGDDCNWDAWDGCRNEGVCPAGSVEVRACGRCGVQQRSCGADCLWTGWGACAGEGACAAGGTETVGCAGGCGNQSRSCRVDCTWSSFGVCEADCAQAGDGCRQNVYRSYSDGSGDHLYSLDANEGPNAGYRAEGTAFRTYRNQVDGTVPLYRFSLGSDHFYTTSENGEGCACIAEGHVGYVATSGNVCGAAAIHRLYSGGAGDHFYTTSADESDFAQTVGYVYEFIAGYGW